MFKTAIVSLVKIEATLQKEKFNIFFRLNVFEAHQDKI